MKQYHDILNELHQSVEKINDYQLETKKLQEIIENTTNESKKALNDQDKKLIELKENVTYYIQEYQDSVKHITSSVSAEFKELTNQSTESINNELSSEMNKVLKNITEDLVQVYGSLNKERQDLIDKLNEATNINKNEGSIIKEIKDEINHQNKHLSEINKETKTNIEKHYAEILDLKSEIEILKENFELKYVYNKKRISLTIIFAVLMLLMIGVTIFTSVYMFSYYSRLIFFPSRMHTLVIGILLCILAAGLIGLLTIVIFKPPTFIKVKKRGKQNEKKLKKYHL